MILTVNRPDGVVGIGWLFFTIDLSSLPENLRVVQWDTDHGHEEWTDQGNTELLSLDPYQHIVDAWYVEKSKRDVQAADPYYDMTKEQVQAAIDVKIVAEEDMHSYLPYTHTDTKVYKVSRALQDTKMRLMGVPSDVPMEWDTLDGETVPMTVGQFMELANAVYDRGKANYYVAKNHKAEMRKLDKPQEYDFSGGWY